MKELKIEEEVKGKDINFIRFFSDNTGTIYYKDKSYCSIKVI